MSYDDHDAAIDEFYDQMSRELYPDHRDQAISEFTEDRLRSFYVKEPTVMRPAVECIQQGKALIADGYFSPALVSFVSAIELLLKATLLKPVVYGLVHHEPLAEIVVSHALGQTGFDRYQGLLSELFQKLAKIDISEVKRNHSNTPLLAECKSLQKTRNDVIHKGNFCSKDDAERAHAVSVAVFDEIVRPMLWAIGLTVIERGEIVRVDPINP